MQSLRLFAMNIITDFPWFRGVTMRGREVPLSPFPFPLGAPDVTQLWLRCPLATLVKTKKWRHSLTLG